MKLHACLVGGVLLVPVACGDDSMPDDSGGGSETGTDSDPIPCFSGVAFGVHDDSACTPSARDYVPGASDAWPACQPDDGSYPLYGDTPSSIERVAAYDTIMASLAGTPTPDAFTQARAVYSAPEGLESRVLRREDLHYPPIPMEQWDPGVDPDKQCNNATLAAAYPQRCAGPALIAPIIDRAFVAGQMGVGVPEVHAARIKAALLWFIYLSVYKEANTCMTSAPKDCDSSWAYYTGGYDRSGGIAFSAEVRALSDRGHQAIWDGFAAFRCLRELVPVDEDPSLDDLTAEQMLLFEDAEQQLSDALAYGLSLVIREAVVGQGMVCETAAEANWAFLRVLGPVLDDEAVRRGAVDDYAPAASLWASEAPADEAALVGAVAALDTVFPCPW